MAYDRSKETQNVMALVDKNDKGDKIQVSKIEVKGKEGVFADIRLMYTPDESDELRPTSKGVRFNTEILYDVVAGLADMLTDEEKAKLADALVGDN